MKGVLHSQCLLSPRLEPSRLCLPAASVYCPRSLRQPAGWGTRHLVKTHAGGFGKPSKAELVEAKRQCPCGSGQLYKDCCKPYHVSADGSFIIRPPTAEACLRARFSAYCMKAAQPLILKTTSAENPARKGSVSEDGKVARTFEEDVKASQGWFNFKGLRIVKQEQVSPTEAVLHVEYSIQKLYDRKTGQALKDQPWELVKEKGKFVQENGIWSYVGAESINWDAQRLSIVPSA